MRLDGHAVFYHFQCPMRLFPGRKSCFIRPANAGRNRLVLHDCSESTPSISLVYKAQRNHVSYGSAFDIRLFPDVGTRRIKVSIGCTVGLVFKFADDTGLTIICFLWILL